jgi:hypothetical protein
MAILTKGLSGEPVKRLQSKLGVEADAVFGSATEKALKDWQAKNGLAADGIAGPDTFMAMGLYELVLLKEGTRGQAVKKLQEKLGVGADEGVARLPGEKRARCGRNGGTGHARADEAVQGDHGRHREILADSSFSGARTCANPCREHPKAGRQCPNGRHAQHLGHHQERVQVGTRGQAGGCSRHSQGLSRLHLAPSRSASVREPQHWRSL